MTYPKIIEEIIVHRGHHADIFRNEEDINNDENILDDAFPDTGNKLVMQREM